MQLVNPGCNTINRYEIHPHVSRHDRVRFHRVRRARQDRKTNHAMPRSRFQYRLLQSRCCKRQNVLRRQVYLRLLREIA